MGVEGHFHKNLTLEYTTYAGTLHIEHRSWLPSSTFLWKRNSIKIISLRMIPNQPEELGGLFALACIGIRRAF